MLSRLPGTSCSSLAQKLGMPQGMSASMPSLGTMRRKVSSMPVRQSISAPSISKNLRMPPGFSAVPTVQSSWREVSNSKRPLTKLVALPPGMLCFSTTSVFLPFLAVKAPAARPPLPAPMTMTS